MTELIRLTAAELGAKLAAGEVSAVEAAQAHLDRIAEVDGSLNAFLATDAEASLAAARSIDERRAAGEALGELAGVPVAIKDILVTTDMPTTAGSKILEGYQSPFDATSVAQARAAGLVNIGKTNMDEFAMGSSNETSAYGAVHNPWNLDRIPGGSGGGSAAAVAAFEAPLAFGSDTGGSIRQPAAFTGSVGFKGTYGSVSRYGAIAMASSLDQIGSCARTVLDTALLQDVISGHDAHDSTSLNHEWPSFAAAAREGAAGAPLKGLRVGLVKQLMLDGAQAGAKARFEEAVAMLTAQGAEIIEIDTPHFEYAVAAYYLLHPAEASSNLAKFDSVRYGLRTGQGTVEDVMSATRAAGFGAEVKRRIILGTYALSAGYYDAYYGNAQKVRTLIQRDFAQAFEQVDVIASLTAPTTAWELGKKQDDPMAAYLNDATTIPANMAGIPGLSLPIGTAAEDGMPVGLQLMAPAYEDARLFRTGAAIEALVTERDGTPFWASAPALGKATA
ncbi:Asp-tRNA(Asn)/Glu-tRNA(Gln) amidotransferase subunit GatA [Leucobacter sp. cx-42]|uniref:Asp-tRNA(Asn)/Glu-tRNA(Gln) amidotransferase subunit GatA n=1 Tax=unclassified Leucobacter TaxID=2621730 RepID=UPI00165DADDD|nr:MULTISPECIES: Asp-tRNA(Asn)/Glu-tRNA(Gln) amidotransferase subunit GatA [unclassified Leucobacter]MBC9955175.1 Asp-tRNA(Asn)/Glu-tRNA(Gln) amidotransferase subunit GatA [Leucobacter sp. cx-42]